MPINDREMIGESVEVKELSLTQNIVFLKIPLLTILFCFDNC